MNMEATIMGLYMVSGFRAWDLDFRVFGCGF